MSKAHSAAEAAVDQLNKAVYIRVPSLSEGGSDEIGGHAEQI